MILVKKKKAFTLVEILVVIAILLIMIAILIGILNPIALVNRAKDSRRKKDLGRIRVAFEEYFNDKGCYPDLILRGQLNDPPNCGTSSVFGKWLSPWPCDPNGNPYQIYTGYGDTCPKWFKILATLENKSDASINIKGEAENAPNYAVSSGNITPGGYLGDNNPDCEDGCYSFSGSTCNNPPKCDGPNCYKRTGCTDIQCQVTCCGPACP